MMSKGAAIVNSFFQNILHDCKDNIESIKALLTARGFLLEEFKGELYVSDNATVSDIEFLSNLMQKYNLGNVIDNKDYVLKSRRSWDFFSQSYEYLSIKPHSVKVAINNDAKIEQAIKIFEEATRISFESVTQSFSWTKFYVERNAKKVSVNILEPYIALYVKAISACGVDTSMSCDGNHKGANKIYVSSNYPDSVWHEFIWNNIVCKHFGTIPYIGNGIPFTQENQFETYKLVYDIAAFLYNNRKSINCLKNDAIVCINKAYRKNHTVEEIKQKFLSECENMLSGMNI